MCLYWRENHELSDEETEWVKESIEKIYSILRDTPPDGEQFVLLAKNMVQVSTSQQHSTFQYQIVYIIYLPIKDS